MSEKNTFREVAIEACPKQAGIVDAITEDAPILSNLNMEEASDKVWHVHEKLVDIAAATLVDLDATLPTVGSNTELEQTNLNLIGGIIACGEDKGNVYPGGVDAYFAKKLPSVLKQTGQNVEQTLFYNNFRAYALANDKVVDAGGSSGANYTMMCVTFAPGEMTGLYSPEQWGDGKAFDFEWVGGLTTSID